LPQHSSNKDKNGRVGMGKAGRKGNEDKGDIERRLDEVSEALQNEVDDRRQDVETSNGFLTSKGKLWSNSEGHAIFVPIGFVSSAFMLPTPLGEITFVALLGLLKRAADKAGPTKEGHWADVIHDQGYFAMAMAATIYFWSYHTGMSLSQVDMTQILLTMLGGA